MYCLCFDLDVHGVGSGAEGLKLKLQSVCGAEIRLPMGCMSAMTCVQQWGPVVLISLERDGIQIEEHQTCTQNRNLCFCQGPTSQCMHTFRETHDLARFKVFRINT